MENKRERLLPFCRRSLFFGENGAMEMDTGLIDSHHALGINVPKADRITYRKVATCSPLRTLPMYCTIWNETNPKLVTYGDTYDRFLFGPIEDTANFTYHYNRHSIAEEYAYTLKWVGHMCFTLIFCLQQANKILEDPCLVSDKVLESRYQLSSRPIQTYLYSFSLQMH